MKHYTRRAAIKLLGVGTMAIAGIELVGCGETDSLKTASEPLTVSEAFGQEGVWLKHYTSNDTVAAKDTRISEVLVFDGNGNVTVYDVYYSDEDGNVEVTFGDLNGLSDDEIVELAKEKNKEIFDTQHQSALDSTTEEIESTQNEYDIYKEEYDTGLYASFVYYGLSLSDLTDDEIEELRAYLAEQSDSYIESMKEGYSEKLSDLESTLNEANEKLAILESLTYQEPQPEPYTLSIETDNTGNNTASEEILYTYSWYSFSDLSEESSTTWIELEPTISRVVYDTTFGGFSGLVTVVNEEHAGFTLDTPDTEGIEVD